MILQHSVTIGYHQTQTANAVEHVRTHQPLKNFQEYWTYPAKKLNLQDL